MIKLSEQHFNTKNNIWYEHIQEIFLSKTRYPKHQKEILSADLH